MLPFQAPKLLLLLGKEQISNQPEALLMVTSTAPASS